MKTASIATLAATLLVSSLEAVSAAECTTKQLTQIQTIGTQLSANKACAKYANVDISTASTQELCGDSACLALLKKTLSEFPDCAIQGLNVKEMMELGIDTCNNLDDLGSITLTPSTSKDDTTSDESTPVPTKTTKPSSATASSASSSGSTTATKTPSLSTASPIFPTAPSGSSGAMSTLQASTTTILATTLVAVVYAACM